MPSQVTDVIGPKRQRAHPESRIPLVLKVVWTAVMLAWIPVYWHQYGPQNFLYYCDIGNLLITVGLWLESRFIFSWQAVGLPNIPLLVRSLGLYHFVVPILLLWAVYRLGYDGRGWKWQIVLMAIVVPITFFWHSEDNINFARGIGHEQHLIPGWLYLIGYLVVVPLVVYWPTHLALRRFCQPTRTISTSPIA